MIKTFKFSTPLPPSMCPMQPNRRTVFPSRDAPNNPSLRPTSQRCQTLLTPPYSKPNTHPSFQLATQSSATIYIIVAITNHSSPPKYPPKSQASLPRVSPAPSPFPHHTLYKGKLKVTYPTSRTHQILPSTNLRARFRRRVRWFHDRSSCGRRGALNEWGRKC